MELQEFLTKFDHAKKIASGYQARCPAHDDKHASLSISNGDKGIILHCHAGCETGDILQRLSLKYADIFDESQPKLIRSNGSKDTIVATYDYKDAQGQLIYQVLRHQSKKFTQRRPDGDGGWIWGLKAGHYERTDYGWIRAKGSEGQFFLETNRYLYRYPELLAADIDDYVFIPEGEKDVDNLRSLGLVAVCSSGGANKNNWPAQFAEALKGRIVVVLPDNDDPGRKFAAYILESLKSQPDTVSTILELPDLPLKGDVSDWIAAGGTADALRLLAESRLAQKELTPESEPDIEPTESRFWRRTHEGLAREFVKRYGHNFRFVQDIGKNLSPDNFAFWTGSRWKIGPSAVLALAEAQREMTREFRSDVRKAIEDTEGELPKSLKELAAFSQRIEAHPFKEGWKAEVKGFSDLHVSIADFDRDPYLLSCSNGAVDLRTGSFREHRRGDLLTKGSAAQYDESAGCPTWHEFLRTTFQGDVELISFVKRAAGYSLTGDNREQVLFICYGAGSNGKSTFLNTLRSIMGDYGTAAAVRTFISKQFEPAANNDLAMLRGARFVTAIEVNEGQRLDEALVKMVTGDDPIKARFLNQEFFEFVPAFKLWFAVNHRPEIRGIDEGIWRRVMLVPFLARFTGANRDNNLKIKLNAELPGILNWAIEGCQEWLASGLNPPAIVCDATDDYRKDQDVLGQFIEERCHINPDVECSTGILYAEYVKWCDLGGMKYPLTLTAFGRKLNDRGFDVKRLKDGKVRTGIALAYYN